MYYPCCENKGADQLRGYREADLRLCFCLCRLLVFPWGGSYYRAKKNGCEEYVVIWDCCGVDVWGIMIPGPKVIILLSCSAETKIYSAHKC